MKPDNFFFLDIGELLEILNFSKILFLSSFPYKNLKKKKIKITGNKISNIKL